MELLATGSVLLCKLSFCFRSIYAGIEAIAASACSDSELPLQASLAEAAVFTMQAGSCVEHWFWSVNKADAS